jgi:hypothetical protein
LGFECFRERPPPQRARRAWAGIFVACQIGPLLLRTRSKVQSPSDLIMAHLCRQFRPFLHQRKFLPVVQLQGRLPPFRPSSSPAFSRLLDESQRAVSSACAS